jgi:hypothetical protein
MPLPSPFPFPFPLFPPPLPLPPLPVPLVGAELGDDEVRVGSGLDVVVRGRVVVGAVVCWSREVTEMTEPFCTCPVGLMAITVASALVDPDRETPNPRPASCVRTSPSRRPM